MVHFVNPRAIASVRDFALVARTVATGYLQGVQQSVHRGVGIEFSQYRSYEPGDPVGRIDWRLYARSDRYFVREAERDSQTTVWLVLDASQSMALRSEQGTLSKFDFGRYVLATLAYVAQLQGDSVGLWIINDSTPCVIPPVSGMKQWHRILHALERVTTSGLFPTHERLSAQLTRVQRAGLTVVVTDLYEQTEEQRQLLRRCATRHNEVTAIRLASSDEVQFPYKGAVRFQDLETGEQVLVSGRAARARYLAQRDAWLQSSRQQLRERGIEVADISIDEPVERAVASVLRARQRHTSRP